MPTANQTRTVVLSETRQLFRHVIKNHFEESGYTVECATGHFLTEMTCHPYKDIPLIVLGVAGSGWEVRNTLRLIHYFSTRGYEVAVWVPEDDRLILRLMLGLGAFHILAEERLTEELPKLSLNHSFLTPVAQHLPGKELIKTLSPSELDILLDASRGMKSKEIATLRHISYKTVSTHKRNACQRLGLENSAEWFELLASIDKIYTRHM